MLFPSQSRAPARSHYLFEGCQAQALSLNSDHEADILAKEQEELTLKWIRNLAWPVAPISTLT
jgi:hypothetical protein